MDTTEDESVVTETPHPPPSCSPHGLPPYLRLPGGYPSLYPSLCSSLCGSSYTSCSWPAPPGDPQPLSWSYR